MNKCTDILMIGDFVQYKGRGGTKRTKENIWEILSIKRDPSGIIGDVATVRLMAGAINDSNNHEYGVGYVRRYLLKNLKAL